MDKSECLGKGAPEDVLVSGDPPFLSLSEVLYLDMLLHLLENLAKYRVPSSW
jgi:hypothetical protein